MCNAFVDSFANNDTKINCTNCIHLKGAECEEADRIMEDSQEEERG
ncbi:hypothetical protein DSOL_5228 [Desulfosporosinus metallidurans]|uniref:Uncharacterized protein n=1 Tax=Desulfosporosinus metallidurans TaxID=1888891 RepID=A0A1Q8QEM7_9FIRM|nr:hypothetical protein DSOL_5228 [Desulfosporosinus metallidurans]